jgi:sugar/nucleoside kinase (ribokinase family)
VGRAARNGLNFTERGFGVRAALGSYDRGHTAVAQLKPGDIDWDEIFGKQGARWFHTGGIFCALSPKQAGNHRRDRAEIPRHRKASASADGSISCRKQERSMKQAQTISCVQSRPLID